MLNRFNALSVIGSLGLALALGCGGGKSADTGALSVHVTDGPISGYQEINVHIQSVEIRGDGGWITLGTPDQTYNLLALTGGLSQTLASGATLPTGHYGQMRLVLGTGNTVKLADGSIHDLTVPSGLQTGIKLIVNFEVAAGTTKDVWIDFDAAHSIQLVVTGASGKYVLRPTVHAFDKIATGAIAGSLTDASSSAPLVGAMVYAESLDGSGTAHLARATVTDATGHYLLDLLPVGGTYHVVSQPKVGSATVVAYAAKASDGITLSTTAPLGTYNCAFTTAATVGGISGGVTPVASADQHDTVNLLQALTVPAGPAFTFIVDTTLATVGTGTETYAFTNLPVGTYGIQGSRNTLNPDGSLTLTTTVPVPAIVTAGATLTVPVAF